MKTKTKKTSIKIKKRKLESEPLTLKMLADYTQKVLLPTLEERLVTKKEFSGLKADVKGLKTDVSGLKIDVKELKTDVSGLKTDVAILKVDSAESKANAINLREEFNDFKNSSLTNQDAILKSQGILLDEKEVREYQKEKEKKLWTIIINSLKEHRILSSKEIEKIAMLDVF